MATDSANPNGIAPPNTKTNNKRTLNESNISGQEPASKKARYDSPQMPRYNSHNTHQRPPAPPSSNNTNNPALPDLPQIVSAIVPPPMPNTSNNQNTKTETETEVKTNKMDTDEADTKPNTIDALKDFGNVIEMPEPTAVWPVCAFCLKPGDLSRCSSCRQAYYCNRDCQVAHWEVHSIVCHPGPPPPPPPDFQNGNYNEPPNHSNNGNYYPPPPPPPNHNNGYHNGGFNGNHSNSSSVSVPRSRSTRSESNNSNGNMVGDRYYCEECDRYFKNGQALGGHRSRVHSSRNRNNNDDGRGPNVIMRPPPEKKKRKSSSTRGRHQMENGAYVCPYCSREFTSGNALGGHISGAHTKKARRAQLQQQQAARASQYDNTYPPATMY